MAKRRKYEPVSLPQVYPGNVKKALQGLFRAGADEPITPQWLQRNLGVTQSEHAWSMLRDFLQLIGTSNCLDPAFAEARDNSDKLIAYLREKVRSGYAQVNCGTPAELAVLFGSARMDKRESRKHCQNMRPFSNGRWKTGGCRNALSCLCTWHDLLARPDWIVREIKQIEAGRAEVPSPSPEPERAAGSQTQPAAAMEGARYYQGRIAATAAAVEQPAGVAGQTLSAAARQVGRHFLDSNRELNLPVWYDSDGILRVCAKVAFDAPIRREYLAALGEALLKLGGG